MYNEYLEKLENLKGKELKNTELKAEKIELGLVDDADKKAKEVKKVTADIEKAIQDFEKAKDKFMSIHKGRTQQSIDLLNTIKDIDKAAKDLGIKIPTAKYEKVLDTYYKVVDKYDKLK